MYCPPYGILRAVIHAKKHLSITQENIENLCSLKSKSFQWKNVSPQLLLAHVGEIFATWILTMRELKFTDAAISDSIERIACQYLPPQEIICVTAAELSEQQKHTIKQRVESKYPGTKIAYKVNPELLGGIRLILPQSIIDGSLATHLPTQTP